jgi:hypothetical protein
MHVYAYYLPAVRRKIPPPPHAFPVAGPMAYRTSGYCTVARYCICIMCSSKGATHLSHSPGKILLGPWYVNRAHTTYTIRYNLPFMRWLLTVLPFMRRLLAVLPITLTIIVRSISVRLFVCQYHHMQETSEHRGPSRLGQKCLQYPILYLYYTKLASKTPKQAHAAPRSFLDFGGAF